MTTPKAKTTIVAAREPKGGSIDLSYWQALRMLLSAILKAPETPVDITPVNIVKNG